MSAVVLGVALVLVATALDDAVAGWRARARLAPARRRRGRLGAGGPWWDRTGAVAGTALVALRRHPGVAVALVVLAVVVGPVPPLAVVAGGALVAHRRRRASSRAHRRAALDELPDLVDLVRLAAEAGLTVPLALREVVDVGDGPVASALGVALGRTARGARLADALEATRAEVPEAAPLVDALVAAERWGAPLLPALDRLGADARDDRRRRAEAEARRVPVRLLFPLVACVLPSVGLLTVVPVAVAALDDLAR